MATQSLPKKRTMPAKRQDPSPAKSKTDVILGLLRRKGGATVDELAAATKWQAPSVRGFLSGTVKKKLGLKLAAEKREGDARRYFVRARLRPRMELRKAPQRQPVFSGRFEPSRDAGRA